MKMLRRVWWIGVGAAFVWFLDAERGQERRAQAKEKVDSVLGTGSGSMNEALPEAPFARAG